MSVGGLVEIHRQGPAIAFAGLVISASSTITLIQMNKDRVIELLRRP